MNALIYCAIAIGQIQAGDVDRWDRMARSGRIDAAIASINAKVPKFRDRRLYVDVAKKSYRAERRARRYRRLDLDQYGARYRLGSGSLSMTNCNKTRRARAYPYGYYYQRRTPWSYPNDVR